MIIVQGKKKKNVGVVRWDIYLKYAHRFKIFYFPIHICDTDDQWATNVL